MGVDIRVWKYDEDVFIRLKNYEDVRCWELRPDEEKLAPLFGAFMTEKGFPNWNWGEYDGFRQWNTKFDKYSFDGYDEIHRQIAELPYHEALTKLHSLPSFRYVENGLWDSSLLDIKLYRHELGKLIEHYGSFDEKELYVAIYHWTEFLLNNNLATYCS